ncbi:MAG: hypothetical protein H7Y30_04480 [Pyrinomonadaceae bacterium]|nr:hypothetical protein [Pyrinomonadaceae bacterium]
MEHPDYDYLHRFIHEQKEWKDTEPLSHGDTCLYYLKYRSHNARYLLGYDSYRCEEHDEDFGAELVEDQPSDEKIKENNLFRYPMVRECSPSGTLRRHKRLTILLHGLNERSFGKYLPWAYHIWDRTREPVALFPLTFSINRVPLEENGDPTWGRQMRKSYEGRKHIENAHLFNATISERLNPHPERFFWGAAQSYWDIVDLVRQIRDNKHPHFDPNARVDFLGYSSGGYLALTLLLDKSHELLFGESRACLFASCVEMQDLRPSSPYVVDHNTEDALRQIFVDNFHRSPDEHRKHMSVEEKEYVLNDRMRHWLEHHPEGKWMRSFCGRLPELKADREKREARLSEIAPRLLGIANVNDRVMPYGAMLNTLQGTRRNTGVTVKELDLGIHEHPFSCPDYKDKRLDRCVIKSYINKELYDDQFDQFIKWIVKHLKE